MNDGLRLMRVSTLLPRNVSLSVRRRRVPWSPESIHAVSLRVAVHWLIEWWHVCAVITRLILPERCKETDSRIVYDHNVLHEDGHDKVDGPVGRRRAELGERRVAVIRHLLSVLESDWERGK